MLKELHQKQKAYEAFFAKLVAYNREFKPTHVPELMLNNARRLGVWCRKMRDLHVQIRRHEGTPGRLRLEHGDETVCRPSRPLRLFAERS